MKHRLRWDRTLFREHVGAVAGRRRRLPVGRPALWSAHRRSAVGGLRSVRRTRWAALSLWRSWMGRWVSHGKVLMVVALRSGAAPVPRVLRGVRPPGVAAQSRAKYETKLRMICPASCASEERAWVRMGEMSRRHNARWSLAPLQDNPALTRLNKLMY